MSKNIGSLTFAEVRARIARIPRLDIAIKNTPLIEACNLAKYLGGPRLFVKRDDLTGIALGGNKLRNLEFRLAVTMAEQADLVIVGLDLQSNSARQTVGACNKLGLDTILVLQGERPEQIQGNVLVDYLLGAEIHFARDPHEQRRLMDSLFAACKADGRRPHILNDNPMFEVASALAYLETLIEIHEQLDAIGAKATAFYMSSSGKGAAGFEIARKLFGGFAVHCVTATSEFNVPARTALIANQTCEALGLDLRLGATDITNHADFVGQQYGVPNLAGNEALQLFARKEGLILDPIYTGKAAAAMVAHIREGRFAEDDLIVFVHTGGCPAIFTWNQLWSETGMQTVPSR